MAEKKPKLDFKYLDDPKLLDRRTKNREAVKKHRENEAIKEQERRIREQKLRLENARLEGEIHQMKISRELLKDLLIDQLRQKGLLLTPQQLEFLADDDLNDEYFEHETASNDQIKVEFIEQPMSHLACQSVNEKYSRQ